MSFGGTGGIFRRNIMLNGQDLMYSEGTAFDQLTVEHNLAYNGTLFWVSCDRIGGVQPTRVTFRYNIVSTVVYDDKTFPAVTSDCNIYMEGANCSAARAWRNGATSSAVAPTSTIG